MDRKLLVLYGSETGTAEDLAYTIYEMASARSIVSSCLSLEFFDPQCLLKPVNVVFCVSTTGDGDVPSRMAQFWKYLLQKKLPNDLLQNVNFAVFGLGDSSYAKFNVVSRKLSIRLMQLGAREIIPIGLGDDQAGYGYSSVFVGWASDLWRSLLVNPDAALDSAGSVEPSVLSSLCTYQSIVQLPNSDNSSVTANYPTIEDWNSLLNASIRDDSSHTLGEVCLTTVKENVRLTSPTWEQNVRGVTLTIQQPDLHPYKAGDIATIYPINNAIIIKKSFAIFHYLLPLDSGGIPMLNSMVTLSISKDSMAAAGMRTTRQSHLARRITCSIQAIFERLLDLQGIPRPSFFRLLAEFAHDIDEKTKLIEISSPEGTDLYYDYCVREKRTYVEIFEDFKSCRPATFERLFQLIPVVQPRYYSIASSGLHTTNEIQLCVAVAKVTTPYGKTRIGHCSGYLSQVAPGDEVVLRLKSGFFSAGISGLPPAEALGPSSVMLPTPPLILIGPGTGVAPMRAVVKERLMFTPTSNSTPSIRLYFGCRRRKKDFFYQDEWLSLAHVDSRIYDGLSAESSDSTVPGRGSPSSPLLVSAAFSQDQLEKFYVTHLLKEDGRELFQMIDKENASIFISGSAKKMPADVRAAFVHIITVHGSKTPKEAEIYIRQLEKLQRYIVEAW